MGCGGGCGGCAVAIRVALVGRWLGETPGTWLAPFYGMPGRRVMDERLAPDFLRQMTRRYGIATIIQMAAVLVAFAAPRVGVANRAAVRRLLPAAAAQAAL